MPNNMLEVLREAAEPGYNYFDSPTMRYWGTQIINTIGNEHGIYFVTSNKRNTDEHRGFSVHYLARGGRVTSIGHYNQYVSAHSAKEAMNKYHSENWQPEEGCTL